MDLTPFKHFGKKILRATNAISACAKFQAECVNIPRLPVRMLFCA